jgi:hypothetical protein
MWGQENNNKNAKPWESNFFQRLDKEQGKRQSEYFSAGNFLCEISNISEGENRTGRGFIVVELKILRSDQPNVFVGEIRSWLQMKDKEQTTSNLVTFFMNLLDITRQELTAKMMYEFIQPDPKTGVSPLKGKILEVRAKDIIIKSTGKPFTVLDFYHVKEMPQGQDDSVPF